MKVILVCGSTRPANYTMKALALVAGKLTDEGVDTETIDLAEWHLSFPGQPGNREAINELRDKIRSADGIILSTPEYHGTMSAAIKLFIENMGFPSALKSKPVALLGVAAGRIGAIKSLEALASVCLHIGCLVLPGSVSVARVRDVFDEEGNCLDSSTGEFVEGLAGNMVRYLQNHVCPLIEMEAMARRE